MQVMSAHMTKPAPIPTDFESTVPAACNRIVAKSMAKAPAERYQTAEQLATELEALLEGPIPASPSVSGSSAIADRPLSKVVIVEPSKLQGAMLKDAMSRTGAKSVQLLSSAEAVRNAVAADAPDLLVTALQLPDGRGIDLLREFCGRSLLSQTTVVLNSSDSTIEELIAVGPAACLALAPKTARPEELLRVAHAAGPNVVQAGPLAAPIDPAALRLQIVLESGRIPDALAEMLRELKLLDVEVSHELAVSA